MWDTGSEAFGLVLSASAVAFLLALPVVVFVWERRLVMPYVPYREEDALPVPPYLASTDRLATKMGCAFLGAFRDGKGRIYRIRYDLWASPEYDLIAVVGAGSLLGIPLAATWVYSRLTDGRVAVTTDARSGIEIYRDGYAEGGLVLNADLYELIEGHRDLIARAGGEASPFDMREPVAGLAALRGAMTARMVEDGRAVYLDPAESSWRCTWRGAIRRITAGQDRVHLEIARNSKRVAIPRPGDRRYRPSWERASGA